jgi:type I restriction enzyme, R subunit
MALEHDKALQRVILELLKDDIEVYKQFVSRNESFKRFVTDMVFNLTHTRSDLLWRYVGPQTC